MYAYPRLATSHTLVRLHEMRSMVEDDPSRLSEFASVEHPAATPVPTGAAIASASKVAQVRQDVVGALERWLTGAAVPRTEMSQFDITLGATLHKSLEIVPADAGHEETWNFLAAVVFPDVVWTRFPGLHQDRVLGKPRNVLRRAWHRHDVIGDLQTRASRPLGEDELTGIFERAAVASNRRLARAMATVILDSTDSNRSEFARNMSKQVTKMTGPLLLDVLDDSEITDLVQMSAKGAAWPDPGAQPVPTESLTMNDQGRHDAPQQPGALGPAERARPTGDLVSQFHDDMVKLAVESRAVLGYTPSGLLGLIDSLGSVDAARRIVGSAHPSSTFVSLWEKGRLDLTIEYLVLDPTYLGLFGHDLTDRATYRLEEHGMLRPHG